MQWKSCIGGKALHRNQADRLPNHKTLFWGSIRTTFISLRDHKRWKWLKWKECQHNDYFAMLSVTSFEFVEITGEVHAFINRSKIIETIFYYYQIRLEKFSLPGRAVAFWPGPLIIINWWLKTKKLFLKTMRRSFENTASNTGCLTGIFIQKK